MQSWCGNLLRYRGPWLGGRGVDVSAWERTSHRAGQVGQRRITCTGTCARPPRAIATLAGQCGMTFWLIMLRSRRVESFRQRAKGHGCGLRTSPPRASRLSQGDQRLVPVEKHRPGGPSAGRSGLPSGARAGPGPSRGPSWWQQTAGCVDQRVRAAGATRRSSGRRSGDGRHAMPAGDLCTTRPWTYCPFPQRTYTSRKLMAARLPLGHPMTRPVIGALPAGPAGHGPT